MNRARSWTLLSRLGKAKVGLLAGQNGLATGKLVSANSVCVSKKKMERLGFPPNVWPTFFLTNTKNQFTWVWSSTGNSVIHTHRTEKEKKKVAKGKKRKNPMPLFSGLSWPLCANRERLEFLKRGKVGRALFAKYHFEWSTVYLKWKFLWKEKDHWNMIQYTICCMNIPIEAVLVLVIFWDFFSLFFSKKLILSHAFFSIDFK